MVPRKKKLPKAFADFRSSPLQISRRTIGDVLLNTFPDGPCPTKNGGPTYKPATSRLSDWVIPPATAPDLFAISSQLLELSGAFSYYSPSRELKRRVERPRLWLSEKAYTEASRAGEDWSDFHITDDPPSLVQSAWSELITYWNWPLSARAYPKAGVLPDWWCLAYQLFIAADEASARIGYPYYAKEKTGSQKVTHRTFFEYRQAKLVREQKNGTGVRRVKSLPATMCMAADPDVVCVQPKSMVSSVGGSKRVFSHHLAAIGPRSVVRTHWGLGTAASFVDEASSALNLLLVPLPYELDASSFQYMDKPGSRGDAGGKSWRTFSIKQDWLKRLDPATHILNLIEKANAGKTDPNEMVHGVVIPELALDYDAYERLALKLGSETQVEFLVAGVSQDCDENTGNFVWCTRYGRIDSDGGQKATPGTPSSMTEYVQSKHHRWKLEASQIKKYKLTSLEESYDWWEHINVGGRELNFAVFRSNSVFATLVCEDLARSEPCHEVLRAVGPNLLFALLMDGPQTGLRWSARYASYLADDPGTAVITLTSRGLGMLEKTGDPTCNEKCIAFVQDAAGNRKEVICENDAGGVILRLKPNPQTVHSIDGRNKTVVRWILDGDTPFESVDGAS